MNIYEFADIIRKDIRFIRYHNQKNRFLSSFEGGEIKGEGVLLGTYGTGKTADKAIEDYANKISNKILVFDAYSETNRQEFSVPVLS